MHNRGVSINDIIPDGRITYIIRILPISVSIALIQRRKAAPEEYSPSFVAINNS